MCGILCMVKLIRFAGIASKILKIDNTHRDHDEMIES